MNNIKHWIDRIAKNEGNFLGKEKIIQEIRKYNKSSLAVEYKNGILIIAIPISGNLNI